MQTVWTYPLLQGANGAHARLKVRDADSGETLSLHGRMRLKDGDCFFVAADADYLPRRGYAELVLYADGGVVKGNAAAFATGPGILRLLPTGSVDLIQRRLFYRVRLDQPLLVQTALHAAQEDLSDGRLLDLSIGGARIACTADLSPGMLVRVVVPDTPAGELNLLAQVRMVSVNPGSDCIAGVQWVRMTDQTAQRVEEAVLQALTGRWGPGARPVPRCTGPLGSRAELVRRLMEDLAETLLKAQQDNRALYEALRITGMTIEELRALLHIVQTTIPAPEHAVRGTG